MGRDEAEIFRPLRGRRRVADRPVGERSVRARVVRQHASRVDAHEARVAIRVALTSDGRGRGSGGDFGAKAKDRIEKRKDQAGIIYCLSRKQTERVAKALQDVKISARHYHAGLE